MQHKEPQIALGSFRGLGQEVVITDQRRRRLTRSSLPSLKLDPTPEPDATRPLVPGDPGIAGDPGDGRPGTRRRWPTDTDAPSRRARSAPVRANWVNSS